MKKINLRKLLPAQPEAGQQIILMAFLIIGLVAALGLAIDGGRLYFARRDTQNAVDAAVLAAVRVLCSPGAGEDPAIAARQAASANGFVDNGDTIIVRIDYPPERPLLNDDGELVNEDTRYFVDVYITQTIEPFFIQVVYGGDLTVTASGLGFCRPAFDPMTVPAVWAGATTCDTCGDGGASANSTIKWSGADSIFTSPSGLFYSGGDIAITGNAARPSELTGSIESVCEIDLKDAEMTGGETPSEHVPPMTDPPLPFRIEDFAPGGYFANRALNDPGYGLYYALTPGTADAHPGEYPYSDYTYTEDALGNFVSGTFSPRGDIEGLYYVMGDARLNQASFADTDGNGRGNITIAATETITANGISDELEYYVGGIIFMSDFRPTPPLGCSASENGIDGSGYGFFEGVIYAPWSGINFTGNDIHVVGALIGQFVTMSNSNMFFEYDPTLLEALPPRVNIAE